MIGEGGWKEGDVEDPRRDTQRYVLKNGRLKISFCKWNKGLRLSFFGSLSEWEASKCGLWFGEGPRGALGKAKPNVMWKYHRRPSDWIKYCWGFHHQGCRGNRHTSGKEAKDATIGEIVSMPVTPFGQVINSDALKRCGKIQNWKFLQSLNHYASLILSPWL